MPDGALALARQLARPEGFGGRVVGRLMDVANRRPLALSLAALAPRAGDHVLDLGCGTGAAMARIRRTGAIVTGVDHSATMIAAARRRLASDAAFGLVRAEQATFDALPVATGSVSAVLALNVLYFWHDPDPILAELRRVLRPDGRVVAYVTAAETMRRWRFARAGLHRSVTADLLIEWAEALGARTTSVSHRRVFGTSALILHATLGRVSAQGGRPLRAETAAEAA